MQANRNLSPSGLTLDAALSLIDCIHSQVAILDDQGHILAVNGAYTAAHGDAQVGTDYLSACEGVAGRNEERARFATGLRRVVRGELNCFEQGSLGRVTRVVDPQVTYLMVMAA